MSLQNDSANPDRPAVKVTPWPGSGVPTEADLRERYAAEGLSPYRWSNGPYDRYQAHTHGYHKVIYVVSGSITFGLPETGESVTMATGDRLDLPAGVLHDAAVGRDGVVCLEGHRR